MSRRRPAETSTSAIGPTTRRVRRGLGQAVPVVSAGTVAHAEAFCGAARPAVIAWRFGPDDAASIWPSAWARRRLRIVPVSTDLPRAVRGRRRRYRDDVSDRDAPVVRSDA